LKCLVAKTDHPNMTGLDHPVFFSGDSLCIAVLLVIAVEAGTQPTAR
jgi:hypothetical protein